MYCKFSGSKERTLRKPMSIWHALHVHVLCISFYHEIMPTSYTQIFRNSKEPYNIKSQNIIAAMMQLTALWLMHFLTLNLNTIITYMNLPSRLEACLFFLLGEKKNWHHYGNSFNNNPTFVVLEHRHRRQQHFYGLYCLFDSGCYPVLLSLSYL